MKSVKYITMSALVALSLSSCSESFLDHPADNRTEIDNEDKIVKLLTSSYPSANYMWVSEMSSDNFIDNMTPHLPTKTWDPPILSFYNYAPYDRADDQLWVFEPASLATYSDYDQPGQIWDGYYASIASVNAALQAIDEVAAKNGGMTATLKAARAEALLIRAYSHFCLVNVFCQPYKDDEASKRDIGIPYVTEVEDVVQKQYDRGNVADVYAKIQADLEEGIANLNEQIYQKPKWHFNNNAAHAFAARFYLYKREWQKVVDHANFVLGTDNATCRRLLWQRLRQHLAGPTAEQQPDAHHHGFADGTPLVGLPLLMRRPCRPRGVPHHQWHTRLLALLLCMSAHWRRRYVRQ